MEYRDQLKYIKSRQNPDGADIKKRSEERRVGKECGS